MIGFQVTSPTKFGIVGSRKSFENLNHFVRVVGSLLGIKDEFNCCGETLDETIGRIEAIKEDILRPNIIKSSEEFLDYAKNAVNGMWYYDPLLNFDKIIFLVKRELQIPGYHYYESEKLEQQHDGEPLEVYKKLSRCSRFRISIDIIVYEILSKYLIFRVLFNTLRGFIRVFSIFPILSIKRFGFSFSFKLFKKKYF